MPPRCKSRHVRIMRNSVFLVEYPMMWQRMSILRTETGIYVEEMSISVREDYMREFYFPPKR